MNVLSIFFQLFLLNAKEMICTNLDFNPERRTILPYPERVVDVRVDCRKHGRGFMRGAEIMLEATFEVSFQSGKSEKITLNNPPFRLRDAYNLGMDGTFREENATVLKNIERYLVASKKIGESGNISKIVFIQFKVEDSVIIYRAPNDGSRLLENVTKLGESRNRRNCSYVGSPILVKVQSCETFCYGKINCDGLMSLVACRKVASKHQDLCPEEAAECCPTATECERDNQIPLSDYIRSIQN